VSCGKEHETPCEEVLGHLYEFLDGEMGEADCAKVTVHLDECYHCLDEYQRDELLKAIVRRSCSGEVAPPGLRTRIMATLITTSATGLGQTTRTVEYRYEI
jgi:anti-sigma factor (TIGR02949 family)